MVYSVGHLDGHIGAALQEQIKHVAFLVHDGAHESRAQFTVDNVDKVLRAGALAEQQIGHLQGARMGHQMQAGAIKEFTHTRQHIVVGSCWKTIEIKH